MGVVHEAGADRYSPTELSNALIQPHYRDGIPNWSALKVAFQCLALADGSLASTPPALLSSVFRSTLPIPATRTPAIPQMVHFNWATEHLFHSLAGWQSILRILAISETS